MDDSELASENERYFPYHKLEKEIGLAEFSLAASRLNTEEQASSWATNTTTVVATAVGFVALEASEYETGLTDVGISGAEFKAAFLLAVLLIGILSINYLANLTKSIVFAERKVVLLRRMLGVKYGEMSLILPNWRVEGADTPLSIKLYPGFFSHKAFALHVIMTSGTFSCMLLGGDAIDHLSYFIAPKAATIRLTTTELILGWLLLSYLTFRRALRESNENIWQDIARLLSRFLRISTVPNFELVIYRIRLEIAEMLRLNTDVATLKKVAVFIEDKEFYKHNGVNIKGTLRALFGLFSKNYRGGGSSITQQLARGQFIVRPQSTLRRKIVEMSLALWLDSCMTKEEIILGYLATARFERGRYGAHRAFKYFFHDNPSSIERWEAFILIERLGNVNGLFLGRRILQIGRRCIDSGVISRDELLSALQYYEKMSFQHFRLKAGDLSPAEVIAQLKLEGEQ